MKYATVTIREDQEKKQVSIGSDLKPQIFSNIEEKWQSILDTTARIIGVPSGLIMRLNEDTIEVFLSSKTEGNPYKKGEKEKLVYGLYCETVIGTQNQLVVPDALESSIWSINNPDINLNMISYLGLPLNWPDGQVFGTVCFLDNKKNYYNKDYEDLLKQIKEHIENDLELMLLNIDLESKNEKLVQLNNIKTRFISLISHDIRGNVGTLDTFLQAISADFDRYDEKYLKKSLSSLSQLASDSYYTLENLLKWSKNDLVDLEPEIESINIIDIVEQILSFFTYLLTLKNIKVTKQFYSEKAIIDTDKNMLTVILRNIISNAIKYSDSNGAIHIAVNLEKDKHTILIKDSGVGMSETTIDKLFSYTKEHSKGTLDESSAGIGLMLTKEFADKIGAKIFVESQRCEGTSFSLII